MNQLKQRLVALSPYKAIITLILIGLAWAVIVNGFQWLLNKRIEFKRPDYALEWTQNETAFNSQFNKPYLMEPFMNRQVSWDSEFYLSIAMNGYDDPKIREVRIPGEESLSLNYAFFPAYPMAMRALSVPLSLFGKNDIGTAALAGVVLAVAGTIAAMIALYDLTRAELSEAGGIRTAFYLLIFPTSFFFAQVYSEGLFVGLAFGALALIRRQRLWAAGVLAALAVWTRSVGLMLVIPLGLAWLRLLIARRTALTWRDVARGGAALLPLLAFALWWSTLGDKFSEVEEHFFSRNINVFDDDTWQRTRDGWELGWEQLRDDEIPTSRRVYFGLEFTGVALAGLACLFTLRRYPGPAVFGLAVIVTAALSGAPQSLLRYILAVPSLYIFLSRLGRSPVFDRAWVTGSLMLMGLLAGLFAQDMWVA